MFKHFLLFLFFALFSTHGFSQDSLKKLIVTPLIGDFYIYTTFGDPGNGSSYPANGMYLVTTEGVVLFDTPWDTTQFLPLLQHIEKSHHQKVVMCFATHFHEDRTAGLEFYRKKGIKTYTSKLTDEWSVKKQQPRAEFLMYKDTVFQIGTYQFEMIYPGPGHAPDNIVFWFDKEKILYGGCLIKSKDDRHLGNLSDANIDEYANSLKKLKMKCLNPGYVIPGHNSWSDPSSLEHTLKMAERAKRKKKKKN